jgi:acyl carrier protein
MTTTTEQRVREIAGCLFNLDPADLTAASSPETVEAWDSLQQLNLVLAIEQEFDLRLDPEDIERMSSVGRVVDLIDEKLRRAA